MIDERAYAAAGVPIRDDVKAAHRFIWEHIAGPGSWWTGAERVAIAAEARAATRCGLCRERKRALSPAAVSGRHETASVLPDAIVDVIHRIRTDPARLSRAWFEQVIAGGLDVAAYVECVGVLTLATGVDYVARALGVPAFPLPAPRDGAPTRYRPPSAKPGSAWVPMIAPEDAGGAEADLYAGMPMVPNIMRALSLVPDQVRVLRCSSDAHYVTASAIPDPTVRRDLDRMQMELVAARVSALNECFY
jgi:hypothetical protein